MGLHRAVGDTVLASTLEQKVTSPSPEVLSFEVVAEQLSRPLLRYLVRLSGNRATADDLLQETLMKIARGLPAFEGRSSVKTWAFTIATRVATDHFRRPEAKASIVDIDDSKALPAGGADVDDSLVVDEMSSCVRGVIDSLPGDYRAALVLHDIEGLTAVQVAEVTDCSLATAKIRIYRGRRRLKDALQDECRFYRDDNDVFRCDRKLPS